MRFIVFLIYSLVAFNSVKNCIGLKHPEGNLNVQVIGEESFLENQCDENFNINDKIFNLIFTRVVNTIIKPCLCEVSLDATSYPRFKPTRAESVSYSLRQINASFEFIVYNYFVVVKSKPYYTEGVFLIEFEKFNDNIPEQNGRGYATGMSCRQLIPATSNDTQTVPITSNILNAPSIPIHTIDKITNASEDINSINYNNSTYSTISGVDSNYKLFLILTVIVFILDVLTAVIVVVIKFRKGYRHIFSQGISNLSRKSDLADDQRAEVQDDIYVNTVNCKVLHENLAVQGKNSMEIFDLEQPETNEKTEYAGIDIQKLKLYESCEERQETSMTYADVVFQTGKSCEESKSPDRVESK